MTAAAKSAIWKLRKGADRRFRAGHPWAYSNELAESPKGLEPGAPVELRDASDRFLARGYGNPGSLIAFRALSRDEAETDAGSPASVSRALGRAGSLRRALGLADVSHRLCFGEADRLPGLVIDRYRTPAGQVFCVQAHSAGAERIARDILEVLQAYSPSDWERTSVVLRNDLGIRKLEGLEEQEPRILKDAGEDLRRASIRVASASGGAPLELVADLVNGQKTGFFLDQAGNVQLTALRCRGLAPARGPLRILDLCCYVGQWGAQLARLFKTQGLEVEVTAADSSASALELAERNIRAQGVQCETRRMDVLRELDSLAERSFDLIISDPPALIKGRKDIPTGTHAYLQLNTQVLRLVRKGGMVVSCSCSGLLEEESFAAVLTKAAWRNQVDVRWVGKGAQSPDHPMLTEFPEGRYLKCWIGRVQE